MSRSLTQDAWLLAFLQNENDDGMELGIKEGFDPGSQELPSQKQGI